MCHQLGRPELDATCSVSAPGLVPGLVVDNLKCVASAAANDSTGASGRNCTEDEFLVVTAHSSYTPVSLLGFLGTINLQAKSRIQMPLSQTK